MVPTLKQLRYFVSLAETCHFGRAARRCNVSQPALSMQVRELEAVLGLSLVERGGQGIVLTDEGREIARRARAILLSVRDLHDYARARQGFLGAGVRLGVIPSVGPYLLPRVLAPLHARFPALQLWLRESQTRQLVDDLVDGRLDLLVVALPVQHAEIATEALFDDRFTLVVPTGHPLAARAEVRERDLAAERLLLLEEGHCLREQALALCPRSSNARIDEFGATSLATVVQMVAGGYGCTLVPELALAAEVGPNARLRVLPFAPPRPKRTVGLAWRRASAHEPEYRAMGAAIREVFCATGPGGGPAAE